LSIKNHFTKILMAVISLAVLAAAAAWQFYLFAIFKDAKGVAAGDGGTVHLWLAIGIALIVCVGGFSCSQDSCATTSKMRCTSPLLVDFRR